MCFVLQVIFERPNSTEVAESLQGKQGSIVPPGTQTVLQAYEALWPAIQLQLFANPRDCKLLEQYYDVECFLEAPTLDGSFHIPTIDRLFAHGQRRSTAAALLFSNADVVLFPDVIPTVLAVQQAMQHFMIVGVRYDVQVCNTFTN